MTDPTTYKRASLWRRVEAPTWAMAIAVHAEFGGCGEQFRRFLFKPKDSPVYP